MTHTVLYHDGCMDGFGSALAVWTMLSGKAEYLPVRYGEPPPEIPPHHVVMIVDFSYPYTMMRELLQRHAQVIMLDHHLGSADDAQRLITENHQNFLCYHDIEECGATLTWQYMYGTRLPMPPLFLYLRDIDLWTWALPQSREVAAALASHERSFMCWELYLSLGQDGLRQLGEQGTHIRRAAQHLLQAILHTTKRMVRIGTYEVPAVNTAVLISEAAHEAMKSVPGAPFGAYYHSLSDGRVKWGLRGEGLVDLNAIAKQFGGGGHLNAASFIVDEGRIVFL